MKAWFYGLQPRERWLVAIGAGVAAVFVLWGFVARPLMARAVALDSAVATKQRLLVDVSRLEGSRPGTVAGNLQGANQTLMVIVRNSADAHGLTLPRTRQNGPSGIDVTFQDAPFDTLVAWLVLLHGTYGVDVETASFSNARQPGLVNGQLSLHRL